MHRLHCDANRHEHEKDIDPTVADGILGVLDEANCSVLQPYDRVLFDICLFRPRAGSSVDHIFWRAFQVGIALRG